MLGQLTAIVIKELRLMLRDAGGLVMLFVLPALFILVLSVALQGALGSEDSDERATVLVVNGDNGDMGDKLIDAMEESGRLVCQTELNGRPLDREQAFAEIVAGNHDIAIIIPEDATQAVAFKAVSAVEILVDPAMTRRVALAIKDSVQSFIYGSMLVACRDAGRECVDSLGAAFGGFKGDGAKRFGVLNPALSESLRDKGLTVKQTYAAEDERGLIPNTVQQNVPGWTIFALFWIAQILSINMIQERLSGAYKRILVSPVSLATYVAGKVIPFFLINLVQALFMFAIGVYVLPLVGTPELELGNPPALLLITVCISAVSIGFGLLMAAVSDTVFFVASMSAALLIILSVVGGIMVPRAILPAFMQRASLYIPHGWALQAYQDIIVRGRDTADILPAAGVLLLFAAAFFIVGILRLRALARAR